MPSAHGPHHFIMERQKALNSVSSTQFGGDPCTFICTECGDGFSHYPQVLAHMAIHGPLESFSFDGSSNGFEVPREYVLQENGTLAVVNGFPLSHSSAKPPSPGVLPHFTPSVKPLSPSPRPQPIPEPNLQKSMDLNNAKEKPSKFDYRCEICSRSFNSLQSLRTHHQYRNAEQSYRCTLCCKIFEGGQALESHLQEHARERFHSCSHCGKRFVKPYALVAHQKESHISVTAENSKNNEGNKFNKMYPCRKCKLQFFWLSDFQTHAQHHCKGKASNAAFASETDIKSKNNNARPAENCYINGNFIDLNNDTSHQNTSYKFDTTLSITPYRCGLCGDRFPNLIRLKEHQLTHRNREPYQQNKELINPKQKITLKSRHKKGKSKNGKLFSCKVCQRVFNHSSSLSRHMRYHKGTMHKCTFCGRQFPQRCDLIRHLTLNHKDDIEKKPGLKHLLVRPEAHNSDKKQPTPDVDLDRMRPKKGGRVNYKCQECGKRFRLAYVYQRHLRSHKRCHNKCPICPAKFMSASTLEAHLKNHPSGWHKPIVEQSSQAAGTNGKPVKSHADDIEDDDMVDHTLNDKGHSSVVYECTECTETFLRLETFLQHQTSHGSENNGRFTAQQVVQTLDNFDDIPSGSDDDRLSASDSEGDEDFQPSGESEGESSGGSDAEDSNDAVDLNDTELADSGDEENSEDEDGGVATDENGGGAQPKAKKQKKQKKVWKWAECDIPEFTLEDMPVNSLHGKGPVEAAVDEIDFFNSLFGEEAIELLVVESNRLKLQEGKDGVKVVTNAEMRKFLGIVIYMSVIRMPSRRDYWTDDTKDRNVADVLTVNRLEQIMSILHVNDNNLQAERGQPGYDRLFKIRPLIDILNRNFSDCAEFEEHMSVDEQIVPFKGHHGLKVYMKKKPKKWGYKLWGLAGYSGFFHKFFIQGDNVTVEPINESIGKSGQVVLDLTQELPQGTFVFFDNYFASLDLLKELKDRGLHGTCTIRANRRGNCPLKSEKELKKLQRGSSDFKSTEGLTVCVWFDNKMVSVASNKCSVKPYSSVRRYNKQEKKHVEVSCPSLIKAYNKYMGGVDRCDMLLSFYRIHHKSRKWYKRLLFHFVDLCIVNAWTLRRAVTGENNKLYKFRLAVAFCLMKGVPNPEPVVRALPGAQAGDQRSRKNVQNNIRYDGHGHLPRQLAKIPKRCKMPGCDRRTKFMCIRCEVYLCVDNKSECFYIYHTKARI